MNNRYLLIIFYVSMFAFLIAIIAVVTFMQINNKKTPNNFSPTPTSSLSQPGSTAAPIYVRSTNPIDKSSNVDVSTVISYTLNRPITISLDDLSVLPQTTYTYEVKNSQVII